MEYTNSNVSGKEQSLQKRIKRYIQIANINKILYSLYMPLTLITLIYLCASPIAMTTYKYVNDVPYTVKEVGNIDLLCVLFGAIFLIYSIIMYIYGKTSYKKISIHTAAKDHDTDEDAENQINKIMDAKKIVTLNMVKAIMYDILVVLIIVLNHTVN